MAEIQDISEDWGGHTGSEVQTFIKGQLNGISEDVESLQDAVPQAIATTTIDSIVAGNYQPDASDYREQTNRLMWAFKDHSTGDIVTLSLDSAPTLLNTTSSPFYNKQTYDAESIYAVPSLASCSGLNAAFFKQTNLQEINFDGQDFSRVTNFESVFSGCSSITSINLSSSAKAGRYLSTCFSGCTALTTLSLGVWNMSNAITVTNFAKNCPALTTVTGTLSGIGTAFTVDVSLDFSASTGLTRESAMVFIDGLVSPNGHTATITFSDATYALLTDVDINKITAAGWVNGNA